MPEWLHNLNIGKGTSTMARKHRNRLLESCFGRSEHGWADLPVKISNVRIARILHGNESGCSFCFPHGFETTNGTVLKNRRSWKAHRKTQYRVIAEKQLRSGVLHKLS